MRSFRREELYPGFRDGIKNAESRNIKIRSYYDVGWQSRLLQYLAKNITLLVHKLWEEKKVLKSIFGFLKLKNYDH